jgi:DNA polymerase III subunit beta
MTDFVSFGGKALTAALQPAVSIIDKWATIPVLSTVRIMRTGSIVRVTSTDLDIEVDIEVDPIDMEGYFAACLPAAQLLKIARSAGITVVKITQEKDNQATIDIDEGRAVYTINTIPSKDWPALDFEGARILEKFTNGRLGSIIDRTLPAVSSEETRYYLNGINWQQMNGGRRFTATDGHRLLSCHYDKQTQEGEAFSIIVPNKSCRLIAKEFKGKDVTATMGKGQTKIAFAAERTRIITKLIDGTYPDFDRVIPKPAENDVIVMLHPADMALALERLQALTSERGRAVKLMRSSTTGATASLSNADYGSVAAKLDATWVGKIEFVGFNLFYLRQMTEAVSGNMVLRFADAGSPTTISDDDPEMTRVIMPMRV